MDVCPTGALSRDNKTQAVVVEYEKCGGCGNCVHVCPFGAVTLDMVAKKAIKCDLCGGDPECVKICPENALQYIDAEKASHYKRIAFANLQRMELKPLVPYPRRG
jgi:Fe-S-cluster-containing hydrogenase component 2